jgi:hypothetical protein
VLRELQSRLTPLGLVRRGGVHPRPADGAPPGTGTLVLIGNAGSRLWDAFAPEQPDDANPLDRWTKSRLDPLAREFGARVIYCFEGPPYWPFLRWARRAEDLPVSPLGLLVDPVHGLWHAYRAAFLFSEKWPLPASAPVTNPCLACNGKPCLDACPAAAFSEDGYDVPACIGVLRGSDGTACMERGCAARRACPIGRDSTYEPAHAAFHMRAFRRNHGKS